MERSLNWGRRLKEVHLRAFVAQFYITCTISAQSTMFEQCFNETATRIETKTDNNTIGKSNICKTYLRTEINVGRKDGRNRLTSIFGLFVTNVRLQGFIFSFRNRSPVTVPLTTRACTGRACVTNMSKMSIGRGTKFTLCLYLETRNIFLKTLPQFSTTKYQ